MYGYVVETRLKGAYYRLDGTPPDADLNVPLPGNTLSPRKIAESRIKALLGPAAPAMVGHHLTGWADLVINVRARSSLGPYAASFRDALLAHVRDAALCWTEILRYRANKPYNEERTAVAAAARWLKQRYRRRWT